MMLTEDQKSLLATSLRVAAEKYAEDARTIRIEAPLMAEQFDLQSKQARELADTIDRCERMHLTI
jgi:hypothetical protein